MEDQHIIREKALRLAIRTGVAPDLDFVWAAQRAEGQKLCFGSFKANCSRECQWYERCRRLSLEPIEAAETPVPARMTATEPEPSRTNWVQTDEANRWVPPTARGGSSLPRRSPPPHNRVPPL